MSRKPKGTEKDTADAGDSTEKSGAIENDSEASGTLSEEELLKRFDGTATVTPLPPLGAGSAPVAVEDIKDQPVHDDMTLEQANVVLDALPPAKKFIEETVPDPFADINDPDILFLINEWGVTEKERIIVRAEVASVVLKSTVKRSDFSKDQFDIQEHLIPKNLTCNMIIDHVPAKIAETGSDLVIISEFLRRAGEELDDLTVGIVKRRTDARQGEAREEAASKVGTGTPLGEPITGEVEL